MMSRPPSSFTRRIMPVSPPPGRSAMHPMPLSETRSRRSVSVMRISFARPWQTALNPQTKVTNFWINFWKNFGEQGEKLERTYTYDFEEYIAGDDPKNMEINIYIAVK